MGKKAARRRVKSNPGLKSKFSKSAVRPKGAGRKGRGNDKSKGRGRKSSTNDRKHREKGSAQRANGAGGKKRKAEAGAASTPRKMPKAQAVSDSNQEGNNTKTKKTLTPKQHRRKQVTKLFSELIKPERSRTGAEVVKDILAVLGQRPSSLAQYCSRDIGSRVIQACLKWGSNQQRRHLFSELKADVPKLAVDRYGHVVVLKLLRYISRTAGQRKPTEEEKKVRMQNLREFLECFRGKNLHATFYHRQGCRVINAIYYSEAVSAKEKRRLLHDVAVPQSVALIRRESPGNRTLKQVLHAEDLTQEQRGTIMSHLREAAERAVDKELLANDIVHLVFEAFCADASEAQLRNLADKCMAGVPYLLSSKPGAEALLRLLGVATSKERKELCRELKGKFHALAMNGVDYLVMMRLTTTVDDTVLMVKTVLAEWLTDLPTLCFDKYGHRVLAWIFRPDDPHLFSPYERKCMGLPSPTSLKAAETRRQELLRALRAPVRSVLLDGPLKAAADVHAKNLLTAFLAADWDGELIDALVKAAEQEATKGGDFGLLGSGTATTTLLVLLKLEPPQADSGLAMPLWQRCFESRLASALTSRCAFVLLALLKQGSAVSGIVRSALREQSAELEAAISSAEAAGTTVSGAKKLLAAATDSAVDGAGGDKA